MIDPKKTENIIQIDNVKPIKTPGQKRQRNIAIFAVLGIIAAVILAYYFLMPKDKVYSLNSYELAQVSTGTINQTIQANGSVVIPYQVEIINMKSGYVSKVYVDEGDSVKENQILAVLDVPELEEDLEDYEITLDEAKSTLVKMVTEYKHKIIELQWNIENNNEDIIDAKEEVEKQIQLVEINSARQSDLESSEKALKSIERLNQSKKMELEEQLELRDLNIELQNSKINELTIKINRIKDDINDAVIRSTIAGEILEVNQKITVTGNNINANQSLFTIADRTSAIIELDIAEQYTSLISEGHEVLLTISESNFYGTVDSVGKIAELSNDGLGATIPVKVTPDTGDVLLTPGSTVIGELNLGSKEDALILPRGAYLTTGNQRYVYKVDGDTAIKTKVSFGEIQGNDVEVLSGIEANDTIILSGYQNFINYETVKLEENQ